MFGVCIISGWHKVWHSLLSGEKWGNFSSSKALFIYSLLFSLKVLTTGSPGAEQLNTSGIYLFMTLFL